MFDRLLYNEYASYIDPVKIFDILARGDQAIDRAMFQAGLAVTSLYYDTGSSSTYHVQQALKIVSQRLSHHHLQSCDTTLGAVGLLVIYDVRLHGKFRALAVC